MPLETQIAHLYQPGCLSPNRTEVGHPLAPQTVQQAADRLARLAVHLVAARGHQKFDFSSVGYYLEGTEPQEGQKGDKVPAPTCGTAGCALGELPYCFPEQFEFRYVDSHYLFARAIGQPGWYPTEFGMVWFGLDEHELRHLFLPYRQIPSLFGGQELGRYATPNQVARNILWFLEIRFNK